MIVGFITYVYLLNPVTYVSNGLFKYTSASLPAIFVSGAVYYVVSKVFIVKSRIGDYADSDEDGHGTEAAWSR